MNKKQRLINLLAIVLLLTNIATIAYYKMSIASMREQSSFEPITDVSEKAFMQCLTDEGIEYKIENSNVMTREIDHNVAIASCS